MRAIHTLSTVMPALSAVTVRKSAQQAALTGNSRAIVMKIKILLISLLVLVLLSGCISNSPKNQAPGFDVEMFDQSTVGKEGVDNYRAGKVSLDDYKGKPLVLNFWAPWCPPCKEEAPALQAVYDKYKGRGIEFLMVSIRDTDQNVAKFMKDNNLSFPVALDTDASLTSKYSVTGVPTTFFIDRKGDIKQAFTGAMTQTQMEEFIREIS